MLDAIAARRSIRKFKNTPVPRHIIEEIIKAGALAPSSKNRQPWHFAVENMSLAAVKNGLGSLWICDIYFAQQELCTWLGGELAAAFALGYADEEPAPRPRKSWSETVEWRE